MNSPRYVWKEGGPGVVVGSGGGGATGRVSNHVCGGRVLTQLCSMLCPFSPFQVHTVDFFRSFISDPFIFGKIAANHALSDCHAMCADARTALAIATVPFAGKASVDLLKETHCGGFCRWYFLTLI